MTSASTKWSTAPIESKLQENGIAIWRASLDRSNDAIRSWGSILSPDEKLRAERFHFDRDRNRFIAARGILRELLGKYLDKDPKLLIFNYGARGKPELQTKQGDKQIAFNLSHSDSLAVYAFALHRRLGIDIESITAAFPAENIARRFFSPQECEELLAVSPESRGEAFFLGWTRKEAYIKAQGCGLQIALDSFDVSLTPCRPAQFLRGVSREWQIFSFWVDENCPGALVYDGPVPSAIGFFSA